MDLTWLGWDDGWQAAFAGAGEAAASGAVAARVCAEGAGIYRVLGAAGERLGTVAGRLRRAAGTAGPAGAAGASELPAVGDWVGFAVAPGGERGVITGVLPRRTAVVRKAAGRAAAAQVMAANVDVVFVVSSLNREWSARRLERYLAVAWAGGARPVVVLNKADLDADPAAAERRAAAVAGGAPVFVGSSGVGKSTLVNALLGRAAQATAAVRAGDDRGRHTTVGRHLLVVPAGGGVVIDTPGLRELQPWDAEAGLARAFDDVAGLAGACRFRDCRHRGEPGCAVAAAVAAGELAPERLANHFKLAAEAAWLAARAGDGAAERARKAHAKHMCKAQKRDAPRRY
jgi:ribosome biogenesis GTPase